MLADELDYVLGVDTHRDEHVLAVVAAPAGVLIAGGRAAANGRGYRDASLHVMRRVGVRGRSKARAATARVLPAI